MRRHGKQMKPYVNGNTYAFLAGLSSTEVFSDPMAKELAGYRTMNFCSGKVRKGLTKWTANTKEKNTGVSTPPFIARNTFRPRMNREKK
ncbi:unnamed protein product [Colias eurytheme]|nr:unnamed protein product [Colias eurytheme]